MKFEVEVNITEKQLLEEIEYWSQEAIQKFMFKIMPKVDDYWTNMLIQSSHFHSWHRSYSVL